MCPSPSVRRCSPIAQRARARTSQLDGLVLLPNVCPVGMQSVLSMLNANIEAMSGFNSTQQKAELTSLSTDIFLCQGRRFPDCRPIGDVIRRPQGKLARVRIFCASTC